MMAERPKATNMVARKGRHGGVRNLGFVEAQEQARAMVEI